MTRVLAEATVDPRETEGAGWRVKVTGRTFEGGELPERVYTLPGETDGDAAMAGLTRYVEEMGGGG